MGGGLKYSTLTLFFKMLIKSTNKRDAYVALINTLLKDNTRYCNNCGATFWPGRPRCCAEPEIGTNAEIVSAIIRQVREIRESRGNSFASNKDKSFRWGVQLPVFIYKALKEYEEKHGGKFLRTNKDIVWFAKNFPQFCIPKTI